MRNAVLALVTLAAAALVIGCRNESSPSSTAQPAEEPPVTSSAPAATSVTLAQLVASPDVYEGKNVTVDGTYNGACGDGDYYFKDKFDLIEFAIVEPDVSRAKVESLAKGSRVRLDGKVKVRRHTSEGPKPEGAEKAESAGRESEIQIAAIQVEVIK